MSSWIPLRKALPPEGLFVLVHLTRVFDDKCHDTTVAKRMDYKQDDCSFYWVDAAGGTHFGQYVDRWANIPDL